MRETIGQMLGWVVVTITAWFVALALMGYSLNNILPWTWTVQQRTEHLIIQVLLIGLYAFVTRPRRGA